MNLIFNFNNVHKECWGVRCTCISLAVGHIYNIVIFEPTVQRKIVQTSQNLYCLESPV